MSTEKIKLLLTEDDPNLGSLLKDYLDAKGFQTALATNGKEGYSLFSKEKYFVFYDECLFAVLVK